ncbi:MAG: DUF308 domain-containing protein [Thaumarchaeota archaeon]|nr:DUF308 domain-containing protein [Nitrososphaerota archaeon]
MGGESAEKGKEAHWRAPAWFRMLEVLLGVFSVGISVVVLASPGSGLAELVVLLSFAIVLGAVRMTITGGIGKRLMSLEALGLAGGGLITFAIAVLVLLSPGLSLQTLVFLLGIGVTIQGLGRILHAARGRYPRWLRGSAAATGAATVLLALVALAIPGIAEFTIVALLSVVVLVNGVESVVSGLRPSNRRQLTLLKLILFSLFYGLVLINWIDLYATSAPAYHVWLVLTYMAPFGVLIVFQGFKDWQLALSLGLLVSLTNDVGYYFVGDLLFGFHEPLLPWIEGQLGLLGGKLLFDFQGGFFTIPVTSSLMGLSIYVRVGVVAVVLYHWWKFPLRFKQAA